MQYDDWQIKDIHWIMVLLESIDVGVVVLDRDYNVKIWNNFMVNHSGLRPEDIRGENLLQKFPEIPQEWFMHKVESVFTLHSHSFTSWENRPYIFRFKNYRPISGQEEFMYQNLTMIPLNSVTGTVSHVCILVYDVTGVATNKEQLKSANSKLKQQSRIDSLTGLSNRGYWEQCLEYEYKRFLRSRDISSLVLFDIDHFKKINDTYGHLVGDSVLCKVSEILKSSMRGTDIAGRYGGEEFGVILINCDAENAYTFSEFFRKRIELETFKHGNSIFNVTISLGISEFNFDSENHTVLIEQADKALYESKLDGRNRSSIYTNIKEAAIG